MQKAKRILALDVGSSSVKGALWDGHNFGPHARISYETNFSGTHVEIPADEILKAITKAGREALRGETSIDAISFCSLASAVVVTDVHGKVRLGAITHQDRRSVDEAEKLVDRFGKKWLLHHLGNLPYPGGIGSSTLAWIHKHKQAALRGKCRVGQLSSLIGRHLTGEWTIDPSQAVFLGLWDIRKDEWNAEMCKAVGVSVDSLPTVKWADEISGRLTPQLAKHWNIQPGVPVVGGFVDTSAAILPSPMLPGQFVHNTGSTDVLAICTEEPVPLDGILTRPIGVGAGPFAGRWLSVRPIASAGSSLAWARDMLFPKISDNGWDKILKQACASQKQTTSLKCVPTFAGVRTTIQQSAGAAFTGVTLATTNADLLGAIVAGLVDQSVMNYRLLSRIHRPQKTVYSMGSLMELSHAMHRAWPGTHRFHELKGDSLEGLVILAQKTIM